MSSIRLPPVVPNPNQDCLDLQRAFRGLVCDADAVIRILAHRDAPQRSRIRVVYKNMFEEDVCKSLESKLHHHFEKAMIMWMKDNAERDATILLQALKFSTGLRRNRILAEILSMKSTEDVNAIAKAYLGLHGRSLQNDIEASLCSSCQKLFAQYLCSNRDEAGDLEPHFAMDDAKKLHNALFTHFDETTVTHIFTSNNSRQLCKIFDAYRTAYGRDIYEVIRATDGRTKNEFRTTVMIIARCISSPEDYFSEILYKSMKGLGTDNDTLIRVIVTRAEVDLENIKATFFRRYKKPLSAMVYSDTSHNYRKFLLALIGAPQ